MEDWGSMEFPELGSSPRSFDMSNLSPEELLARQDRCNFKVDPIPDPIRKFKPTSMFYTETLPSGSAKKVHMVFVSFDENVGYTVLCTQQELAEYFSQFQSPKNKEEYLRFISKVRRLLPRVRPTTHSRIYNKECEFNIHLEW